MGEDKQATSLVFSEVVSLKANEGKKMKSIPKAAQMLATEARSKKVETIKQNASTVMANIQKKAKINIRELYSYTESRVKRTVAKAMTANIRECDHPRQP